ncbi:MAG: hypothetical protein MR742_08690 [Clostridiales bacterium]|nr:hypothetical protein [Clostridiales bacterium]
MQIMVMRMPGGDLLSKKGRLRLTSIPQLCWKSNEARVCGNREANFAADCFCGIFWLDRQVALDIIIGVKDLEKIEFVNCQTLSCSGARGAGTMRNIIIGKVEKEDEKLPGSGALPHDCYRFVYLRQRRNGRAATHQQGN